VLLTSLGTLMVTSVVFMLADSTVWLFVARGIQGLATGLALGSASAALLDLHPRRDPASVGLANGVVSAGGMGLGIGISSLLVELAPAPRVLPYVVLLVLFAVAFYGALRMPEPVPATGRAKLTPQRPRIPPAVRRPFLLAALAVISSWSIGGLFISLGPALGATLLHTDNHVLTGLGVVTLAGAGAAAQLAFGRSAPWAGTALGSLALATGMVAMVIASSTGTIALYWFGALIGGAGFGVAFLGGLRALSAAIPPQHRAEVMSAFYVVAYLAISLPAVLAGVLVTPLGLESTFEIFGSVVAALALAVAFEAYRTRPATARLAVETA
jgi:MFS family permease